MEPMTLFSNESMNLVLAAFIALFATLLLLTGRIPEGIAGFMLASITLVLLPEAQNQVKMIQQIKSESSLNRDVISRYEQCYGFGLTNSQTFCEDLIARYYEDNHLGTRDAVNKTLAYYFSEMKKF